MRGAHFRQRGGRRGALAALAAAMAPASGPAELELRQRLTGAPTGAVAVLLHDQASWQWGGHPGAAAHSGFPSHHLSGRGGGAGSTAATSGVSYGGGAAVAPPVHVAYPCGDAVVVTEVRAGRLSDTPHVIQLQPMRPTASTPHYHGANASSAAAAAAAAAGVYAMCAWAPGDLGGLLAVGGGDALHLYAPAPLDHDHDHHPEHAFNLDGPPDADAGTTATADTADTVATSATAAAAVASAAAGGGAAWEVDARVGLDAAVVGVSWTEDGAAVMVATKSGFLGVWALPQHEHGGGGGGDETAKGDASSPGGVESEACASEGVWRRRAAAPQPLLAAVGAARYCSPRHPTHFGHLFHA